MNKLNPCPFCGNQSPTTEVLALGIFVLCGDQHACKAKMGAYDNLENAIHFWNNRAEQFDQTLSDDAFNALEDEHKNLQEAYEQRYKEIQEVKIENQKLKDNYSILSGEFLKAMQNICKKEISTPEYEYCAVTASINRKEPMGSLSVMFRQGYEYVTHNQVNTSERNYTEYILKRKKQ